MCLCTGERRQTQAGVCNNLHVMNWLCRLQTTKVGYAGVYLGRPTTARVILRYKRTAYTWQSLAQFINIHKHNTYH